MRTKEYNISAVPAVLYGEPSERALLVSPILDMERMILDMMRWAGVTEAHLTVYEEGEHWFHTPEQLTVLRSWEEANL